MKIAFVSLIVALFVGEIQAQDHPRTIRNYKQIETENAKQSSVNVVNQHQGGNSAQENAGADIEQLPR